MLEIWIAGTRVQRHETLEKVLSEQERARSREFRREEISEQYIVAHALKRLCIASRIGRPDPRGLRFARLTCRKPVLLDAPLHFNLSHSQGICAVVLSTFGPCGIDVEMHGANRNLAPVLLKTMTPHEREAIGAAENPYAAFVERWVVKEAYAKLTGLGLAERFDLLCTERGITWHDPESGRLKKTHVWRRSFETYSVAVCASGLPSEMWCREIRAVPQIELRELIAYGYEFTGAFGGADGGATAIHG